MALAYSVLIHAGLTGLVFGLDQHAAGVTGPEVFLAPAPDEPGTTDPLPAAVAPTVRSRPDARTPPPAKAQAVAPRAKAAVTPSRSQALQEPLSTAGRSGAATDVSPAERSLAREHEPQATVEQPLSGHVLSEKAPPSLPELQTVLAASLEGGPEPSLLEASLAAAAPADAAPPAGETTPVGRDLEPIAAPPVASRPTPLPKAETAPMTSPAATTAGVADGLARAEPTTPEGENLVHGATERRVAVTTAPVGVNRGPSESPTPPRVPAGAAGDTPSRSLLGLLPVPAPLAIRLDGSRRRETDRETETVSGRITGGPLARLVLHVNGTAREVGADRGAFQASVPLQPGLNHLRAVATDWRGIEAEDAITVEYALPPAPYGIKITSPADGYRIPPDAPPFVFVEGEVENRETSSVWLFANQRRLAVLTNQGRFRQILPLFDPVVTLWAQTPVNGGSSYRSQPLLVGVAASTPPVGVLVMDWGQAAAGVEMEISALWRARPDRATAPEETVPLQAFKASPNPGPSDVFYLRNLKPGVYAVVLRHRSAERAGEARPTLYLPEGGQLRALDLRPVSLNGTGTTVLAKILLPQGILWEQDDWFTGRSESADTVTKFRLPEGITWTERKADPR